MSYTETVMAMRTKAMQLQKATGPEKRKNMYQKIYHDKKDLDYNNKKSDDRKAFQILPEAWKQMTTAKKQMWLKMKRKMRRKTKIRKSLSWTNLNMENSTIIGRLTK